LLLSFPREREKKRMRRGGAFGDKQLLSLRLMVVVPADKDLMAKSGMY
jgi:hypothetical protein